jgi:ABC-2 type transport system ATP-binding protein
VIADGTLRAQGTLQQVLGGDGEPAAEVRAQDPTRLTSALEARGHRVQRDGDVLLVLGATAQQIGEVASEERVAVLGLAPRTRSLEQAFFAMTGAPA